MKIPSVLPLMTNRVWRSYTGGSTLDSLENKENPSDSHFPEDWLLSTTPAINPGRNDPPDYGISIALINDKTILLSELIKSQPELMLGKEHLHKYGVEPSFLLKFLDSSVRLHIQCHPAKAFSREHFNVNKGKAEGYLILACREDIEPFIYLGFQRVPDKKLFRQAIIEQDTELILSFFDRIPVKPGDVFFVPGGVPHAIGAGVFMTEIMEATDFAVRIEFERAGYLLPESARFMNRDIDFALSMFDFSNYDNDRLKKKLFITPEVIDSQSSGCMKSLFNRNNNDCFQMKQLALNGSYEICEDSFYSLTILKGAGKLVSTDCELTVRPGSRFFIPALTRSILLETDDKKMEAVIAAR